MHEGNAIVYCAHTFGATNGKTAHGLVRRSERYRVLSVIDPRLAGRDAGDLLGGRPNGVLIYPDIASALKAAEKAGEPVTHFVVGVAPDGGRMDRQTRQAAVEAVGCGLHVVSGLHDYLCEDAEIAALAKARGVKLVDVRKPPPRSELHAFTGKIEQVESLKIAVLGTDSAVGKRTTAWAVVDGFRDASYTAELVGTGQTAWLQGARYSIILDSLVSDFLAGEIEHAVWSAWNEQRPDAIIIEGQGSLMNPAYPGGYEILAAGRPDVVILQHAPARRDYDGFAGYRIHPVETQIKAIELVSGKPVAAITINHERLSQAGASRACAELRARTGLFVGDVLRDGTEGLIDALLPFMDKSRARCGGAATT